MIVYLSLALYCAAVSLFAVIMTVHDKNAARKGAGRVRERTLMFIAVIGGSAVMLLTMLAIRHKTRHKKFMIGLPLIILIQVVFAVFAFNQ